MYSFLIQHKEVINIVLQFLIALAGLFVVITLWYHRKAVLLQKDSLQASMFSDISARISTILGEIPPKIKEQAYRYNWYIRLFNEFESLIFLVKHKYLSLEMENYYRHFIVEYVEDLSEESAEVAKDFASLPKTTFCNLCKYYEDITGKKFLS